MTCIASSVKTDTAILRPLLETYAEAAALPVQEERRTLWRQLNDLAPTRPLVWINEIPWDEMNVDDELTLRCEDPYLRAVEGNLRRTLYQWRHMAGDMVIDPWWTVPRVCAPRSCYADYGIKEDVTHGTASSFHGVIRDLEDVEKMQKPAVTVDRDETARRVALLSEIADGILPVREQGIVHAWATPWDVMIRWYGIEQLYMDMYDRPELVHALLTRYMKIQHAVLDEQEALGLLDVGNGNHRVGSGGLGFTSDLPRPDPGEAVQACHQWGCGNAQIFSEVSPDMHWEFSLQYEKPYMERFGLTYYGCCEPLHKKLGILRRINNLRKISMSPYVDVPEAAEAVGADYVFSYKPNPAILAGETWDPGLARAQLKDVLRQTRGCRVEIIMKDISTVRSEPQRLWDWCRIAMEEVGAADG